jgi:Uma2 family endonuclease
MAAGSAEWYDSVQTMVQLESPAITVSEDLFRALVHENPDVGLERAGDGRLIVVPPAGIESSRQNIRLSTQLENWNERVNTGVAFDSSAGFRLPNGATYSPDAAWLKMARWLRLSTEERRRFAPVCPDFVVELLSASDELSRRVRSSKNLLKMGDLGLVDRSVPPSNRDLSASARA